MDFLTIFSLLGDLAPHKFVMAKEEFFIAPGPFAGKLHAPLASALQKSDLIA